MEPTPVIPLEYAAQGSGGSHRLRRALRILTHVGWIACLIAAVLIPLVDVETVVVTGPVIFVLGAALLICGVRARSHRHTILGAAHCAICLLFFMLVQQFNLSPQEATVPFAIMGASYSAFAILATVWVEFPLRKR